MIQSLLAGVPGFSDTTDGVWGLSESRAIEESHVSSKSLRMVQDGDKGVLGGNGREKCFSTGGH